MDYDPYMIDYLFKMESHELDELNLLHKIVFESSPEMYKKLRGNLLEMIDDTMTHIEELYLFIDELRMEGAFHGV